MDGFVRLAGQNHTCTKRSPSYCKVSNDTAWAAHNSGGSQLIQDDDHTAHVVRTNALLLRYHPFVVFHKISQALFVELIVKRPQSSFFFNVLVLQGSKLCLSVLMDCRCRSAQNSHGTSEDCVSCSDLRLSFRRLMARGSNNVLGVLACFQSGFACNGSVLYRRVLSYTFICDSRSLDDSRTVAQQFTSVS